MIPITVGVTSKIVLVKYVYIWIATVYDKFIGKKKKTNRFVGQPEIFPN